MIDEIFLVHSKASQIQNFTISTSASQAVSFCLVSRDSFKLSLKIKEIRSSWWNIFYGNFWNVEKEECNENI